MRILIADDEPVSRIVLERTLRALDFEVDIANDGDEAWQMLSQRHYPIVVADWVMPQLDGIELCRRVRANDTEAYIYFILLTSKMDKQDRLTGLQSGADDFISKPFDRAELAARLGVARRILHMETELRDAKLRIEERRRQEIEIGANIQRSLLMARPPEGTNAFEFAAMNLPSSAIDGDFFDFFVHRNDVVDIIVGDAMGKGIPAALIGAGTKNTLLRSVSRLMVDSATKGLPRPKDIVQVAHSTLARELIRLNSFVTLEYARLDAELMRATFVDCGHTKVLHWSAETQTTNELSGGNFPIGFVPDETYGEFEVSFGKGDLFCFYSDGVTEAKSPDGELFGVERLVALIDLHSSDSPSQLIYRLREVIRSHTEENDLDDDFTVVVVRSGPVAEPWERSERIFPSSLQSLGAIRQFVGSVAMDCGLDGAETDELELATHEAVTNVIVHAHGNSGTKVMEIVAERLPQGVSIRIIYEGPEFTPGTVDEPSVSIHREGGWGLFIIQRCVNQVNYGKTEDAQKYIELVKLTV
jgi:sigma-B regulation protein RsbU (phosphoserine phosphatase)